MIEKIRRAINSNSESLLREVYVEVFGVSIKEGCGDCYNKAIEKLIKFARQNQKMQTGKYRFKKEFEYKKMTISHNGGRLLVDASNLTESTAEMLIHMGKGGLIELNPNHESKKKESGIVEPTSSTLTEPQTDGQELAENVSVKESTTKESKPLTVAKKKKKF